MGSVVDSTTVPFYRRDMSYLLGADPELRLLTANGETIRARSVISDECYDHQFGMDGDALLAEIRPTPTDSPHEMVRGIRAILKSGYKELGLEMQAGTGKDGGMATGGHLHLGGEKLKNFHEYSIADTKKLSNILDVFIGIPLLALEPPVGRFWRREHSGYGAWSDLRYQHHGVEYRTPSSWLVSPATTRIAVALAWLVIKNLDSLTIPRHWKTEKRKDYNYKGEEFGLLLSKLGKKALESLKKLPDYKKVGPMLESFEFLVDVVGDWREGRNVVDTWSLRPKQTSLPPIVEETNAEDGIVDNLKLPRENGIIWNNDQGMDSVKQICGEIETAGPRRLWVVGTKKKRGRILLLSPALMVNEGIKRMFTKHEIKIAEWPNFPEKNGEMVVGLPLELRLSDPIKAGMLVRLVALTTFNRLKEKARVY